MESYRAEFESIARDSRGLEDQLASGAGMVKQSVMKAAEAKVAALEQRESAHSLGLTKQKYKSLRARLTLSHRRILH